MVGGRLMLPIPPPDLYPPRCVVFQVSYLVEQGAAGDQEPSGPKAPERHTPAVVTSLKKGSKMGLYPLSTA